MRKWLAAMHPVDVRKNGRQELAGGLIEQILQLRATLVLDNAVIHRANDNLTKSNDIT